MLFIYPRLAGLNEAEKNSGEQTPTYSGSAGVEGFGTELHYDVEANSKVKTTDAVESFLGKSFLDLLDRSIREARLGNGIMGPCLTLREAKIKRV